MGKKEQEEEGEAISINQLMESVDSNSDDPELHFQLGLRLWESGGDSKGTREKAAEHFLTSAKLNPNNAASFKYLGYYYSGVSGADTQRAIKCFQRAVVLCPDDEESGEALCDLLDEGGKETLEVATCRDASEKSARAFWAFRRLGYLQLNQKSWPEAVQSLQHGIRGYPACADLWEALGLAYQQMGMYTAAIKSYGRAIELDETKAFSRIESGNILLLLGSFRKGIEQFRKALEILPENLAAQYGLASGLLGLSKECVNTGAFAWSASLLEEASKIAISSAHLAGNASSLWKLHGDIQIMYAKCFPWLAGEEGLSDREAFESSIISWNETRDLAAKSARKSYQKALHLSPWQANIYSDIAFCSNVIAECCKSSPHDFNSWQLSEKMALGALLLESDNSEFWVALGCVSDHKAFKQHCFIRALQLDVAQAVAWAYLGKLFREVDEKLLARQAFDSARSIDPSLSLPWSGMSADFNPGMDSPDEAFENCLRAVQTLPLPEFQLGLAKIALLSRHSSSSLVYGAIRQAVQRAPYFPESHNLLGLILEARHDYISAAASYRVARYALHKYSGSKKTDFIHEVSINLARSLCKAGSTADAVQECEELNSQGVLDAECMQIYALSLWRLGRNQLSISVIRNLATSISSMDQISAAVIAGFICRLLYYLSGLDATINSIEKMPKELFESPTVSFIISAIHVLDEKDRLNHIVSASRHFLTTHELRMEMHLLISLGKVIKNGSASSLGYQSGVHHLRKALHMFPNSDMLRDLLGYLLLFRKEQNDFHLATRCCVTKLSNLSNGGLKSAFEVVGAGAVSCYAVGSSIPKFTFPTCSNQCLNEPQAVMQLQKSMHQEPWNFDLKFLLVLNLLQKAREERYPLLLCGVLKRLCSVALSNEKYERTGLTLQLKKLQLLLCASEACLQEGNLPECINIAKKACKLLVPDGYLFFAHLLLSRAYAVGCDMRNSQKEYERCLELGTDLHIGWISLKLMESRNLVAPDSNTIGLRFEECLEEEGNLRTMWTAVFNFIQGLMSLCQLDFQSSLDFLTLAGSLVDSDSCIFLCQGVACMELAKAGYGSEHLSAAIRSLVKAQEHSLVPLPIISTLLAQAEGSLGFKEKWVRSLQCEWFTWPPEMRPAELFFQIHLLARQPTANQDSMLSVETHTSPLKWVCRAIHTDPTPFRYWRILRTLEQAN
ncbi:hypothetical protein MLD38_022139 [Melastoma candidum]|uniref:Uncharacterized protein n=1 Tax=Melastoma candidum TaxID=119954 RepID=A0ACB9QID9_9MYRT|nr:hypothetical protein MLD38_022139 [Melastoma candidum]